MLPSKEHFFKVLLFLCVGGIFDDTKKWQEMKKLRSLGYTMEAPLRRKSKSK